MTLEIVASIVALILFSIVIVLSISLLVSIHRSIKQYDRIIGAFENLGVDNFPRKVYQSDEQRKPITKSDAEIWRSLKEREKL